MKALTIRNLSEIVSDAVRKKAEDEDLSFSKALVALLEEHIAENHPVKKKKRDLSYIAGSWTEAQAHEFDEALREQRQIDPEMWK